jgi:hypothetical protein
MKEIPSRLGSRCCRWGALAAAALGVVACRGQPAPEQRAPEQPTAQVVRATPAPPFAPGRDLHGLGIARRDSFVVYLASLTFDTSPYAADRRFLLLRTAHSKIARRRFSVGPYAELAPEIGAEGVPDSWPDSGRVLARIVVPDRAYAPLHIVTETTYVCVRGMVGRPDSLWALLIAVGRGTIVRTDSLRVTTQRLGGPIPNVARFRTDTTDEAACFPCDNKWCCAEP